MKPFESVDFADFGSDEFPILASIANAVLKRGRAVNASIGDVGDQEFGLEYGPLAAATADSDGASSGGSLTLSHDLADMLVPCFGKVHTGEGTWLYMPGGKCKILPVVQQNKNGDVVEALCAAVEHSDGTTSVIRLDEPFNDSLIAGDAQIMFRDLIGGLCVLISFLCDAIRLFGNVTGRLGILQGNLKLACSVLALQMGDDRLPERDTESENGDD